MKKNLDPNILTTATQTGKRLWIYPEKVSGLWQSRRTFVFSILCIILLIGPWLRWQGRPLFLFNLIEGKFLIFGVPFFSHDLPLILYLVLSVVFMIACVTAIWGRVWCGWACPQTVFTEGIVRRIERWIEGDAFARRKLDASKWTTEKWIKKSLKWICFFLLSLVISHSLLAYVVGADRVAALLREGPALHFQTFLFMMCFTGILLFDFGWFREQFCTLVCPYGRLQSVLVDESSMGVFYQTRRGEPRGKLGTVAGDCVDCGKCVSVCPTGIDIRNGLQLECIQCTACMDACDQVMRKVGKPRKLIGYSRPQKLALLRPTVYAVLLTIFICLLSYRVHSRHWVQETWLRSKGSPYEIISESSNLRRVVNRYELELQHQGFDRLRVVLEQDNAQVAIHAPGGELWIEPASHLRIPIVFEFDSELTKGDLISGGKKKIQLWIRVFLNDSLYNGEKNKSSERLLARYPTEVTLIGPLR